MRKPLIAGNWKMNLNHLEAIAVTQKLSYSLEEKDFEAVDVVIFPPFTDIRSVQTLIDGDRLRLTYGAQDLSPEASGAARRNPTRVSVAYIPAPATGAQTTPSSTPCARSSPTTRSTRRSVSKPCCCRPNRSLPTR